MPVKKRFRRRRVRRKRRSRRNKRSIINTVTVRGPFAIADKYRCKMQATQTQTVTAGGFAQDLLFASNSIFDPFLSDGNNQPMGFDQLVVLYASWRVRASKIEIHITNTATNVPFTMVCLPSLATTEVVIVGLIGLPYLKQQYVGMATGMDTKHLTNFIKPAVMFGDRSYDTDLNFVGSTSANPAILTYWKLRFEATGGSAGGTILYQARYVITYWVDFFDRRQISASSV